MISMVSLVFWLKGILPRGRLLRHVLILLLGWSSQLLAADYHVLDYAVVFNGKMSGNKPMEVALARWSGPKLTDRGSADLSLRISTEQQSKVESMTSFRYCHKAKYSGQERRTQGFEIFQRSDRKLRYFVAGFDWQHNLMRRLLSTAELPSSFDPLALFRAGEEGAKLNWRTQKADADLTDGLLDRLSMVQHVRSMKLTPGQVVSMQVTDGKETMEYWVSINRDKALKTAGRQWDSYKLTFETFDLDPSKQKPPHPPVDIWISRDSERIPLRLYSQFPFGTFEANLVKTRSESQPSLNCKSWPGFEPK